MPSRAQNPFVAAPWLRAVTAACLLALAAACGGKPPEPIYEQQFFALGTLIDITLWGVDERHGARAAAAVMGRMNRIHQRFHAWQPGPLTQINAGLARGETVEVPPDIAEVIRRSQELSRASGGLFNPAIGGLVKLWGFHGEERAAPPPPQAIAALVGARPSMEDLVVQGTRLRSTNPALRLDLASYIKGYAVNDAIEFLRQQGIENAIVNAGGDLRAIGKRGDRPWRIGIRDPRGPGMLAALEVQGDECVFTSGDYERYFTYRGRRYHHIIDPRTGYPAAGVAAATVVFSGPQAAAAATSASTALVVAGMRDWLPLARAMGLRHAMVVGGDGRIEITPELRRRLRFTSQLPQVTIRDPL